MEFKTVTNPLTPSTPSQTNTSLFATHEASQTQTETSSIDAEVTGD